MESKGHIGSMVIVSTLDEARVLAAKTLGYIYLDDVTLPDK
jgi:hypothetical protein